MGRLIDITQFDGMSKEERKAKAEELDRTGRTVILVKPTRPREMTAQAIVDIAFHEWKQHSHGQLELVRMEEREVPGVLAILKACPDMNVRQALSDLRYLD